MKTKIYTLIPIILVCFFVLLVQPLHAKVYKWKDENGKTHYTDSSEKIPFKYRKNMKEKFKNNQTTINCNKQLDSKAEKKIKRIKARIQKSKDKIKNYRIKIREQNSEFNKKIKKRQLRYSKEKDKRKLADLKRGVKNRDAKNPYKGTQFEKKERKRTKETNAMFNEDYKRHNKNAREAKKSSNKSDKEVLKLMTRVYKKRIQREEQEIKKNRGRLKLICEK